MSASTIEVLESGVRIRDLDIPRKAVADFLRDVPADELELRFIQALEVGSFCLERADGAGDLEFVRHQVDELMRAVQARVIELPGALEQAIVEKMGDGEGQVLAPIRGLVDQVDVTLTDRLKDVRALLTDDLDPAKATSTLGAALARVSELLDPSRKDSIQAVVSDAVGDIANGNGELAAAVRGWVGDAIKPLAEEVSRFGQQLASAEAVDEALQSTTKKGTPYELEIVSELQEWGARMGIVVEHAGGDNRPGDVIVDFPESSIAGAAFRIVVEVRDRATAVGRKVVAQGLGQAMSEREADAAIYLSKCQSGLAKELGDWAEGECASGSFVATTHEFLLVAVRWLLAQEQLRRRTDSIEDVDRAAIQAQVERVRTALKRVSNINTNLTSIRSCAAAIEDDADKLRADVRGALAAIEDALRALEVAEAAEAA